MLGSKNPWAQTAPSPTNKSGMQVELCRWISAWFTGNIIIHYSNKPQSTTACTVSRSGEQSLSKRVLWRGQSLSLCCKQTKKEFDTLTCGFLWETGSKRREAVLQDEYQHRIARKQRPPPNVRNNVPHCLRLVISFWFPVGNSQNAVIFQNTSGCVSFYFQPLFIVMRSETGKVHMHQCRNKAYNCPELHM